LSVSNVFGAICAGFADGTVPEICQKCVKCHDTLGCVESGYCTEDSYSIANNSSKGVSTHTFATSMFLVIALFSGLAVWHYKRTREDMRDQVRGILAEYMPLEDQDGGVHGSPMDFARGGAATSLIS